MAVTSFQDFDLADADREWDSDAAEKCVRRFWASHRGCVVRGWRNSHRCGEGPYRAGGGAGRAW